MATVRDKKPARKSNRFNVVNWLSAEDSLDTITSFARKSVAFSRAELDDLTSEVVVALLEDTKAAPATEAEFLEWLPQLVETVAARLRNVDRRTPGTAIDGEILEAVAEECDDDTPPFTYCHELVKHEKNLRARVKRVMKNLTKEHRKVIEDKFFLNKKLSAVAAKKGMCDSSHRMRLLRAKAKLATLMTADGYALAA